MSTADRREPDVVGRYVLCDEIAAGGMATVHIGRLLGPVGFARTVAIKRLHAQFAKDPEFVAMFLDEARIAARIRHPNVVSTLDVVVLKGEMLVVMEYVHGEPLSRLIRACRAQTGSGLPPAIALSILAGALYGLHAAHEARDDHGAPLHIVHRDVSPQNILVGQDGIARVVDFGVAKAVGRLQTTREGSLKGKLPYMSPEQVRSEQVDRRTDIYAASVVLWEMLTGQRLFTAENDAGVLNAVLTAAIPPPGGYVRGLPPELDALVLRGLARDPSQRFATAGEMAEAVQQLAYATPGQIGAWVKHLGGTALDQRAARVVEIESTSSLHAVRFPSIAEHSDSGPTAVREPPAPVPSPPAQPAAPTATQALVPVPADAMPSQVSSVNVASPLPRRRRTPIVLAVLAPLGVAAAIGLALLVTRERSEPAASASASPAATPTPRAEPSAEPSASASAPAPSAQPPAVASTDAPGPSAVTPSKPASTAAPKRPPRPNCNPPFTIDKRGVRVPKMECL